MESIKKILVGLDLTLIDQTLIRCANLLNEVYQPEKIIFIHVVPANAMTRNTDPEMKLLNRVQFSVLEEELREEISEYGSENMDYEVIIKNGSPFAEIIASSITKDVDLLVMGKKKDLKGSGIVPLELTRFSPTSILFVPEKHKCKLDDITVCNDFSRFSAAAMNSAIGLARNNPENISITSLHVHNDSGLENEPSYIEEHQKLLIERYNKFIADLDLSEIQLTPKFLSAANSTITKVLNKYLNKRNTDLVIAGSRGRSVRNTFLIGSLTEKLVRSTLSTPLLVIKPHLQDFSLKEELMRELQNS